MTNEMNEMSTTYNSCEKKIIMLLEKAPTKFNTIYMRKKCTFQFPCQRWHCSAYVPRKSNTPLSFSLFDSFALFSFNMLQ